jgi:IS30 family transposase
MGTDYSQLDIDERYELFRLREAGTAQKEMAVLMNRSESTISRELRRNALPKGGYRPGSADRIALSRRRRLSKLERLNLLGSDVRDRPAMGWSPEQIAGRLKLEGSDHSISHESIYRYIYRPKGWPRSCTAIWPGPRHVGAGAILSTAAFRLKTGVLFTSGPKRWKSVRNPAIGRAI